MVMELAQAGCRYVGIDGPGYTAYVDADSLAAMRARGEEPMATMARSIAADNEVIADFPGVTFGVHICRGNRQSMWHREGQYDAIAETLFNGLKSSTACCWNMTRNAPAVSNRCALFPRERSRCSV